MIISSSFLVNKVIKELTADENNVSSKSSNSREINIHGRHFLY